MSKYLITPNLRVTKTIICCERVHKIVFDTFGVPCVRKFEEQHLFGAVFPLIPMVTIGAFVDKEEEDKEREDKDKKHLACDCVYGCKNGNVDTETEKETNNSKPNPNSNERPDYEKFFKIPDTPVSLFYASSKKGKEGKGVIVSVQHSAFPDDLLGLNNVVGQVKKKFEKSSEKGGIIGVILSLLVVVLFSLLFLQEMTEPGFIRSKISDAKDSISHNFPPQIPPCQPPSTYAYTNIELPVCYTIPQWSEDVYELGYSGIEDCCFKGDQMCHMLKSGNPNSEGRNVCLLKQSSDKSKTTTKRTQFVEAYRGQCRFEKANGKAGNGIEGVVVKN